MILRMAGSLAAQLSKAADIVEPHRWLSEILVVGVNGLNAREMEDGPEQHGGMTVGKHEAVAIRPSRVLWVKAQNAVPNGIDQRSQRHGRAGVAGLGRLYGIYRKGADRIDRLLNHFVILHKDSSLCVLPSLIFQRSHLAQPAHVSFCLTELGG